MTTHGQESSECSKDLSVSPDDLKTGLSLSIDPCDYDDEVSIDGTISIPEYVIYLAASDEQYPRLVQMNVSGIATAVAAFTKCDFLEELSTWRVSKCGLFSCCFQTLACSSATICSEQQSVPIPNWQVAYETDDSGSGNLIQFEAAMGQAYFIILEGYSSSSCGSADVILRAETNSPPSPISPPDLSTSE